MGAKGPGPPTTPGGSEETCSQSTTHVPGARSGQLSHLQGSQEGTPVGAVDRSGRSGGHLVAAGHPAEPSSRTNRRGRPLRAAGRVLVSRAGPEAGPLTEWNRGQL